MRAAKSIHPRINQACKDTKKNRNRRYFTIFYHITCVIFLPCSPIATLIEANRQARLTNTQTTAKQPGGEQMQFKTSKAILLHKKVTHPCIC